MRFFIWYLIGLFSCPVLILMSVVLWSIFRYVVTWCRTKHKELKARKEWHYDNPYWQEAFDAGAKWAEDGKPCAKPFLARFKVGE